MKEQLDNKINSPKIWYQIIHGLNEKEKFPIDKLIEIFSEEVNRIVQKNIDPEANIVFELNQDKEEIRIFNTEAIVISDNDMADIMFDDPITVKFFNISLSEAKKINKSVEVGDTVKIEIDLISLKNSNNPSVQKIPKIIESSILQAVKRLQKSIIYEKYSNRIGETVKATFISKNKKGSWNVQINEDGTMAHLPANLISAARAINPGSIFDVVIESVDEETKLSQITVSLDSPKIVEKILFKNIPEIANGQIEIVNIIRSPGERTKAVFRATEGNENIDVYGAIIGQNSSRINLIFNDLNEGLDPENYEKVDIILHSDNVKEFIRRCLEPGHLVSLVQKGNDKNTFYAITTKSGLSAMIGKKGSNTTLASKLTGLNFDVITTEEAKSLKIEFDEDKAREIDDLIRSEKRYKTSIKKPLRSDFTPSRRNVKRNNNFNSLELSFEGFDKDILAFKEKEQEFFDQENHGLEFDELIQRYGNLESEVDSLDSEEFNEEPVVEVEKIKEDLIDYKKAKDVAKNFKIDNDLSNFGLDEGIDLSDINDEEW
ncbi:NusA N-terminal domain-containing protein [Mycoplasma tauri]|uniref:NusA N-terminal domain-containing protein n=1 Tax=Mycoplasma tauri TaxID=547987 RepID=UPI001CBBE94D|nr:NusA N-terminal domain-containing protein [Mycoplasma tauri]MBZ4204206.1 transcription termination/antitermination protein NusA [Mycoplasma tauri]